MHATADVVSDVVGGVVRLRVALVGLGWAARSIWLPRLREHADLVVAAVVDPDAAARAASEGDGVATVLASPTT